MGSGKSGITAVQVFKAFEKILGKTNTLQAIKDWIDETTFTESLDLNEKSLVYVYAHFIARRNVWKTGRRVILVCNDDNINNKLLTFYKSSGWHFKTIKELPFAVMNTDDLKKNLRETDKELFDMICSNMFETERFE